MFYAKAGLSANPFQLLLDLDILFALAARDSQCPHCGGRLDQAHYPRRPRGASEAGHLPENQVRFSYCCATEGCRRRLTPFSVRFLGPKVYFGVVIALLSALRNGPKSWTVRRIVETFDPFAEGRGPSARTVLRWVAFWREKVVGSPFWRRSVEGTPRFAALLLACGSRELAARVPRSLLEAFGLPATAEEMEVPSLETLKDCLEFFSPLTSQSAPGSFAV